MRSVENTRRELFEAWFESLNHYTPMKNIYGNLWGYYEPKVQDAWLVWNAALDSVVIELPGKIGEDHGGDFYTASIHDSVIAECRDAIESTNLGIKLK